MRNPISITLDINSSSNSRITNVDRARKANGHYALSFLVHICGAKLENLIQDLQWCAENNEDDWAIEAVARFAEAVLFAYETQAKTYKQAK